MQHPYLAWKAEYEKQIGAMVIIRGAAVDAACRKILRPENWSRYSALEQRTKIPASFVGALDWRESDCDPRCGLGQGDPWNRVSTHVPRGCGPFDSWLDAAVFYVHYDHLDDNSAPWSLTYEAWKGESWNGLGYRYHGVPSPYLFAGTNLQRDGFYKSDGKWDPHGKDMRVGIIPIIVQLGNILPELKQPFTSDVPASLGIIVTLGPNNTLWLQQELNALKLVPPELAPLVEDGNYGRRTRAAVRAFQVSRGLEPDGLFGPKTAAALALVGHA